MAKLKGESQFSERTKAIYPKINDRYDEYNGKKSYVINAVFTKKYAEEVIAYCEQLLRQAQQSGDWVDKKGKPLKWSDKPKMGFKVDEETGEMVFRFHTNTSFKDKEGNDVERKVPIRDSMARPVDVSIGHGSIVKIKFTPEVYHANADNNGVTLYLDAVQVLELKTFSGADGDLGFGIEESEDISSPYEG